MPAPLADCIPGGTRLGASLSPKMCTIGATVFLVAQTSVPDWGLFSGEYDIRPIDEELYIAVVDWRKQMGTGIQP